MNSFLTCCFTFHFSVEYYQKYIAQMQQAISKGVNIKGYFAWSLLDNFEWVDGYEKRFGLHYVDFQDPQRTRYAKDSAKWYASWIDHMREKEATFDMSDSQNEDKKRGGDDPKQKKGKNDADEGRNDTGDSISDSEKNEDKKHSKKHHRSNRLPGEEYEVKVMTECFGKNSSSNCSWLDYLYAAMSNMITISYGIHNNYYEEF